MIPLRHYACLHRLAVVPAPRPYTKNAMAFFAPWKRGQIRGICRSFFVPLYLKKPVSTKWLSKELGSDRNNTLNNSWMRTDEA